MPPIRRSLADVLGAPQAAPDELSLLDAATPAGAGAGIQDTSVLSDADLAALAGTGADVSAGESIPVLQNALGAEQDPTQRMDIQQQLALAARRRLAGV